MATTERALERADDAAPRPGRERILRALSSRACLAVILIVAALLRVAHVLALRPLPLFDRLIIDSELYDAWAQRIAGGDWLTRILDGPFYMDPLYPYFLGAVYRLAGRDVLVVRLLQVAFGVATCWLVARLATRLHGALAGNVAAALLAAFGPSIFQEGEFEKTALGVFLATAALLLFLRISWRSQLAAGAVFGLAALTRGNILLLGPFAVAYLLARRAPRPALAFAAGAALVIAPVTARNVHVSGEWVLTTAGAGQVLYTGNNPANEDGAFHSPPFVRPQTAHEEGDFRAEAERRLGRRLTARETSTYWLHESLRHMTSEPAFAMRVLASKAALFWSDVEVADAWGMQFVAGFSPVLRLPLVSFAVLLGLAVLGVGATARRSEGRVVLAYVLLYALSVIAFFIFSRYRLHVAPALAALAGVGLASATESAAAARWRSLAWPALAALAVASASMAAFPERRREPLGNYAMLAEMYQERGDFPEARRLLGALCNATPKRRRRCVRSGLSSSGRRCAGARRRLRIALPRGRIRCSLTAGTCSASHGRRAAIADAPQRRTSASSRSFPGTSLHASGSACCRRRGVDEKSWRSARGDETSAPNSSRTSRSCCRRERAFGRGPGCSTPA